MTCKTYRSNGITAIVCSRGDRPIQCKCGARGSKLCDYLIGAGKTCDKPLCDRHAHSISAGVDYCEIHSKMSAGAA